MDYEIIDMEERTFAGVTAVTNNSACDMTTKIAGLWQKLYSESLPKMSGRTDSKAIGLYCDYQKNGDYTVLVGCQVNDASVLDNEKNGLVIKSVPSGRYARFIVHGDVQKAVCKAWEEIWSLGLERTFCGDYEEYQEDCDGKSGTIHIYIAVK